MSDEIQHGTVSYWNGRSYGFIRGDAIGPELFVHLNELNGQRVNKGDRVSYRTAPDNRNPAKLQAVQVQVGSGGINDHADTQ